jgi:hypothetical protein
MDLQCSEYSELQQGPFTYSTVGGSCVSATRLHVSSGSSSLTHMRIFHNQTSVVFQPVRERSRHTAMVTVTIMSPTISPIS